MREPVPRLGPAPHDQEVKSRHLERTIAAPALIVAAA